MKKFWLLLIPCILFAYDWKNDGKYHLFQEEKFPGELEVKKVFSSIQDLNHPTLQDYLHLEKFLEFGVRSYLYPIFPEDQEHRKLQLIGKNHELPIFEKLFCNSEKTDLEKCILLYSSYEPLEKEQAYEVLDSITESNYRGHILFRIGGFPNISRGGLTYCHIPGSWKMTFFEEARLLGYQKVVCLDPGTAIPDLETVFHTLDREGSFFQKAKKPFDPYSVTPEALLALRISPTTLQKLDRINTSLVGLNLRKEPSVNLLKDWRDLLGNVVPAITFEPDTLDLSVLAWKHHMPVQEMLEEAAQVEDRPVVLDECHCCQHHIKAPLSEIDHVPQVLEKYLINVEETNLDKCVLLYLRDVECTDHTIEQTIEKIKISGYEGQVLLRRGGYPNVNPDLSKLCHIPCSSKIAFLEEARSLGYKQVLFIDPELDMNNHFQDIFKIIQT
ncbi:MAG: hypothetical protein KAR79_05555, partial [Simkaniaceae bacterium]|nr:hypothetical protein [Simkaniaceae bacterium]